eukprot:CAMPEP_0170114292 /NCGR_PEP_ID=MMETSP0020_2-20130122/10586_1 /TAXON_ID=98059 /ORGANISM="Dinobryon sp., Strain UTEXLB2267" /LENGTH=42 /DNA_ID= /DNA_START= /DNA_END= /DNA_ORIENTATION=
MRLLLVTLKNGQRKGDPVGTAEGTEVGILVGAVGMADGAVGT